MDPFDKLDEQLISALREDPRASAVKLADRLLMPRSVVAQRLRRLLASQVVRVVATVHPAFMGLDFIGHLSVSTSGPVQDIAAMVAAWEECVLVSVTAGEFDFIAEVRVHDQVEMQQLLTRLRGNPQVIRVNTAIYTDIVKGNIEHRSFETMDIDDIDRQLLAHLEQNGRLSWKELSERVDRSPSVVRNRAHRILEAGIAQIFVVQQRGYSGGIVTAGVGLSLRGDTLDTLHRIAESTDVEFAAATVGRFDALVTVRGSTPRDIDRALDSIRELRGVAELHSWFHLRSVKEDYARRTYFTSGVNAESHPPLPSGKPAAANHPTR